MIRDEDYEMCKKCPYYYGEIDECMVGEPDVAYDETKAECRKDVGHKNVISKRSKKQDNY